MIRLSDLLGSEVIDRSGTRIGRVRDVRLVQDGPYIEGFGQTLRLDGLIVGDGGLGIRFGFVRHQIEGPWLLRWIARKTEAKARFVAWSQVHSHDIGRIDLAVPATELPALLEWLDEHPS